MRLKLIMCKYVANRLQIICSLMIKHIEEYNNEENEQFFEVLHSQ